MSAEIGIKIGADNSELVAVAAATNKILSNDIPEAVQKATEAFEDFEKVSNDTVKTMGDVPEVLKKTGDTFKETTEHIQKGSQTAKFAVIDFGHVLRDLPFALNNPALLSGPFDRVTQLFIQLKQESGGVKQAFSAIGSQLTGGAGILIGIELVTSALAVFSSTSGKAFESAKKDSDKYNDSLKSITSTLADEAVKVSVLVSALQNENLTRQQKKSAIEELKRIAPDYFGQLTQEKDFVNELSRAYAGYIESLKAAFAAKALDKQLSTLFDKKINLEIQLDPQISALTNKDISTQLTRLRGEFERLGGIKALNQVNIFSDSLTPTQKRLQDLQKAIISLESTPIIDLAGNKKQLDEINSQIDGLIKKREEFGNFDIKIPVDPKTKTELDNLKKQIAALEELKKALGSAFPTADEFKLTNLKIQLQNLEPQLTGQEKLQFVEKLKQDFFSSGISIKLKATQVSFEGTFRDNLQKELDKGLDVTKAIKKSGGFDKTGDAVLTDQIQLANEKLDILRENGQKVASVLTGTLKSAFDDLFTGIVTGSQNAFQAFGNALTQIIQKLIVAALEAAVFSAIISAVTGGFGSTAAGGGFLSNFKGLFSSLGGLPKFANGGIASGPKSGFLAVLHGNELVVPLDKATKSVGSVSSDNANVITGVLTAQGDKIAAVIKVVNKRKGRLG